MKKTLFILPQSAGDLVEFTSVVDGYRKKYPNEELYLMIKKRFWKILEDCDYLKLVEYPDPFYFEYFVDKDILKYSIIKKYDKIYLVSDKLQTDMDWIQEEIFEKNISRLEYYASVVGLNKDEIGETYFLKFNREITNKDFEKSVIIHTTGSKFTGTGWSYFQELVDELIIKGKIIYQVGGENDELLQNVHDKRNIPYKELLELIVNCKYFVGIDSFIMHICAELGSKGVALFGNTVSKYALHNKRNLTVLQAFRKCDKDFPCHLPECEVNNRCIDGIAVAEVLEKLI